MLNNDQLLQLVANGKISPQTAEMYRQKNPDISQDATPVNPPSQEPQPVQVDAPAQPVDDTPWWAKSGHQFLKEKIANELGPSKSDPDVFSADAIQKRVSGVSSPEVSGPSPASVESPKANVADLALPSAPKQGLPVPDLGLGDMNKAFDTQAKAAQSSAQAQAKGYEQQANILDQYNKDVAPIDQQIVKLHEQRAQEADKRLQEIEKMNDQVTKETQINPNRYWENMSTGNKVAASISIALGAIGAAMLGSTDNKAWNIINGAIDRDIEAQKSAVQNNRYKLEQQKNLYGLMLDKFGNQETALMATKAVHLGQAENMIKAQLARTNSDVAKANGEALLGQIKQKQAELGVNIKVMTYKMGAAQQATMGEGVENPMYLPEDMQKRAVKMDNGLFRVAASEEGAKEINHLQVSANDMLHTLNQMKLLQQQAGRSMWNSDSDRMAKALMSRLIFQNQQTEGINRLSEPDIQLLEKQISNPTSAFRQDNAANLLNGMIDHIRNKVENARAQYIPGYRAVQVKSAPSMRK